jgi:hypothetical protein
MRAIERKSPQPAEAGGVFRIQWRHRLWWLLPLVVLILLIGTFYVLGHLSAADPEMYPTTLLSRFCHSRTC